MVETIERKIFFYEIEFKKEDEIINPQSILSYINSLPFDENGRYLLSDEESILSMFVESKGLPLKGKIGTIRKKGLPLTERYGETKPLKLPLNTGLYEPTHFIIFPDKVAGFEFNFYGPRPTSLKNYILNKASAMIDDIKLLPIIRRDTMQLLSHIGEIKAFGLNIHRDMEEFLKMLDDNLFDTFSGMKKYNDAEYIEIIFRAERHSKKSIHLNFLDRLPEWIKKPEVKEGVDSLRIRARDKITKKIEEFDLLQEYLISKKQIVRLDDIHKSVNPTAMYSAINEAYNELKSEIKSIIREDKNV
jgi:hypothetical protein